MSDKPNRRNFLRILGMAPLAAVAVPAVSGETVPVAEQEKLLHWTCDCGEEVFTRRPMEDGETVGVKCSSGHRFAITWRGTHYGFRRLDPPSLPVVSKKDWPVSKWSRVSWLRSKFNL